MIDQVRIDHGGMAQTALHIVRGSRQDVVVVGQARVFACDAALEVLEQFLADLDAAGIGQEYIGGLTEVQFANVVVVVHQGCDLVEDAGRNFVHLIEDKQGPRTVGYGTFHVVVKVSLQNKHTLKIIDRAETNSML